MRLGLYIHIPYCLQRCSYCDFTTFSVENMVPMEFYLKHLYLEIKKQATLQPTKNLSTIYFGGGTPSLLEPYQVHEIFEKLSERFHWPSGIEITLEINPATLNEEKLKAYKSVGINRLSVGVQTFNDKLLKLCGRKHNAQDAKNTLNQVRKHNFNFSLDILFALPHQSLQSLEKDLDTALEFSPHHISPYCLTVPEQHPMSYSRAPEGEQVQMLELIERKLLKNHYERYEISNFSKKGFESQHNKIYWEDEAYLGLGVSAHSYIPSLGPFGTRFWNSKNLKTYFEQVQGPQTPPFVSQKEVLKEHEALTDFCHTSFRTLKLDPEKLKKKFPKSFLLVKQRIKRLEEKDFVQNWRLTEKGVQMSNLVFYELSFLEEDLAVKRALNL